MNHDLKATNGRMEMPSSCRVPHGTMSLDISGGVNGLRVGITMHSLLTRGISFGRFRRAERKGIRRVAHRCGSKHGFGLGVGCAFWGEVGLSLLAGGRVRVEASGFVVCMFSTVVLKKVITYDDSSPRASAKGNGNGNKGTRTPCM